MNTSGEQIPGTARVISLATARERRARREYLIVPQLADTIGEYIKMWQAELSSLEHIMLTIEALRDQRNETPADEVLRTALDAQSGDPLLGDKLHQHDKIRDLLEAWSHQPTSTVEERRIRETLYALLLLAGVIIDEALDIDQFLDTVAAKVLPEVMLPSPY